MTWGNDLWNQIDNVSSHTYNGIEFIERFSNFIKDKALIESDYSKQLNNLVKKYQPKKRENEENVEIQYSYVRSFNDSLFEVHQIAVQHEFIGQYYRENILPNLLSLIQYLKEERKTHLTDISKMHQNLKVSVDNMTKAKKVYIDAFKSSEEAQSRLQKSELDPNAPRPVAERKRSEAITKLNICEDAKINYASQLCKTNELQHNHYTMLVPSVFDKLEAMDKRRIDEFKRMFSLCVETERKTSMAVGKFLANIENHCQMVNADNDAQLVVDRYKSESNRPSDYTFVDMSNEVAQSNRSSRIDVPSVDPSTYNKKIYDTITEIQRQIKIKSDEREGAVRMRDIYSNNPELGNARTIELMIDNLNNEIIKLESDLRKHENSMQGNPNQVNGRMSATFSATPDLKIKEKSRNTESLGFFRRSPVLTPESAKSPNKKQSFTLPFKKNVQKSYNVTSGELDDSFDLEFDSEPTKILGSCKALYAFTDESISIKEGELFSVLEQDSGDGWTKVRSKVTSREGFVPTSYLSWSVSTAL